MNTVIFVGTKKGGFVFTSDAERREWQVSGPHFPGWVVQHLIRDTRTGNLYAALDHMVYGCNIHRSTDNGATWHIAKNDGYAVSESLGNAKRIWSIAAGHPDTPEVLWAGGDPGALWKSADSGETWQPVTSFNEHATRDQWMPGAGGMMVHSICPDPSNPNSIVIGMSVGGVYRSDDAGETWRPTNTGIRADFQPVHYPEVGQCIHHMERSPVDSTLFYQQNHDGVYRSEDDGVTWIDCTEGLPSRFGFPLAVHHHKRGTIFTIPQVSPDYRFVPEGKLRVYRSRSGGDSWQTLTNGLPQDNAYLSVYRLAMAADAHETAGVYFGTTGGTLYYTRDEGDSWEVLSSTLPPIYSVTTAIY